ncbi:MAG: hypothetical protein ABFD91_16270 [Anaerohalosphaeraceae bacterium]
MSVVNQWSGGTFHHRAASHTEHIGRGITRTNALEGINGYQSWALNGSCWVLGYENYNGSVEHEKG